MVKALHAVWTQHTMPSRLCKTDNEEVDKANLQKAKKIYFSGFTHMYRFSHEWALLHEGEMLNSLLVEPHFYLATGRLLAGTEEFWHPSIVHYSSFQVYQIWSLALFSIGFLPGKLEACTQEDDDCISRVNIQNFWDWEMLLSMLYMWVMRRVTSRKQQSNCLYSKLGSQTFSFSLDCFCLYFRSHRYIGHICTKTWYTPTLRAFCSQCLMAWSRAEFANSDLQ